MKEIELKIEGMKCEGCVNRIKNVLSSIKGISSYELSLEEKTLTLEVKKEKTLEEVINIMTNKEKLNKAIEQDINLKDCYNEVIKKIEALDFHISK